ncbi:hypothetical protein BS614_08815 [Paenibacillus xylanexedens]|nr:hypothetical protein BS614_08815 [Paenibacillus xylanexedens]
MTAYFNSNTSSHGLFLSLQSNLLPYKINPSLQLKVSKPKKLRVGEDDLFWIIDIDGDFNIIGVR